MANDAAPSWWNNWQEAMQAPTEAERRQKLKGLGETQLKAAMSEWQNRYNQWSSQFAGQKNVAGLEIERAKFEKDMGDMGSVLEELTAFNTERARKNKALQGSPGKKQTTPSPVTAKPASVLNMLSDTTPSLLGFS